MVVSAILLFSLTMVAGTAGAVTLPDHRAYELVTRFEENGREVGMNGVESGYGVPSLDGNAVDWGGIGACCGATSGAINLFQSNRGPAGWQTKAVTPAPSEPLDGIFEEQAPMFWTDDLQQTIFAMPGAKRPKWSEANDLYLESPTGSLTWLSQGPAGTGTERYSAKFDGATPNAGEVVFNSAEQLTSNATGLASQYPPPQYLYVRDVANETTTLVDVDDSGALLGPYTASLGNGNWLSEELVSANYRGTNTNAISADGSKIFFETPISGLFSLPPGVVPHLYMRDLANDTTTPLDDPSSSGTAQYEGAAADGSLVFFTSNEGLDGASTANELYVFNTTSQAIGSVPPMSSIPVTGGDSRVEPTTTLSAEAPAGTRTIAVAATTGFVAGHSITVEGEAATVRTVTSSTELELNQGLSSVHPAGAQVTQTEEGVTGVSAISNDGSRVYFVANGVLTSAPNPVGRTAQPAQPNLYVYDTRSGDTAFVTTLGLPDVSGCDPNCGSEQLSGLVAEPDVSRPTYPTPDGAVLVFESTADLTGQAHAPTTTLTTEASSGDHQITVASTAGFLPNRTISIDVGGAEELDTIESVDSPTELTLSQYDPSGLLGLADGHPAGTSVIQLQAEVYRYSSSEDSLLCLSCTANGVTPTGSADLGGNGGGSYAPPGQGVPISEDGSRVFFDSPDPLLPGVQTTTATATSEPSNVYEWENGQLSLISNGSTAAFSLAGTTPSGNDVFFGTRAELVPGVNGGSVNIYDARVNGGFPEPPVPPEPCTGQACRSSSGGAVSFSVPASSTLGGVETVGTHGVTAPTFTVSKITSAQRTRLARTGHLTLSVTVTAAGRLTAEASAKVRGKSQRVARATVALSKAGTATLKLDLSKAARTQLAKQKTLALRLEVSYSASGTDEVAALALHAQPAKTSGRKS